MVSSTATTIAAYLAGLPAERRTAIEAVHETIRSNLPRGYEEAMQHGMIAYVVPLATCPDTYNGLPLVYAALASQKQHMAVYLMGIYGDDALRLWFETEYRKTGLKWDVGKSCVRFKSLDTLPLALIGKAIARLPVHDFIGLYEKAKQTRKRPQ